MRTDDRGVLDMPVRLAVAILIIATVTPVLMGMVGTAEDVMSSSEAEVEADRLCDGISRAYYGGEGTMVSVELSIPAGQSLELGGDERSVIRILDGGMEVDRVYIERPAVPVLEPVTITGRTVVTIQSGVSDGDYGVWVSV